MNASVEVNPSGVRGKSLHLPNLRQYSWLFSFQEFIFMHHFCWVCSLALPHSLFHNHFCWMFLKGNTFQGLRAQHFGAVQACQLSAAHCFPCTFAWLEADGSGAFGQPESRWHAQGVLSAPARCTGAKLSSSESILLWHFEACSKSGKEVIRL